MNKPLDPDVWVMAQAVLRRSQDKGLDPVEQLHRHDLLRTPGTDRNVRVEAMTFLLNELTSWRPVEMLRSRFHPTHTATPADMYSAIVAWMGKHIDNAKQID